MCNHVVKTRINATVDPEILAQCDLICKKHGVSRSNVIETFLKMVVANPDFLELLKEYR